MNIQAKIELGQKFYRYIKCGGIFEYVVKQINNYESCTTQGNKKETLYVLECQACSHGYKCLLQCAVDDYGNLVFIKLDSDDPNYDGEYEDQKYWHHGEGIFHTNKKDAMIEVYNKSIKILQEDISKLNNNLKDCTDKLSEYQNLVKELI